MKDINNLTLHEIDELLKNKLIEESPSFMFAFTKKLIDINRIQEALSVLLWIEKREHTFKYTHENQLRHTKAILLSHESIKDWDGAIDILRSLYHSQQYHLKEPEVLTLLASNYKRKALYGCSKKEKIDMTLLTSALCLYEDAYDLKPDNQKHYDAINLAYLYNIVDAIEIEHADRIEIERLYADLSEIWRIDTLSWWEVCSNAEFLMLLGELDLAIEKMDHFFHLYSHTIKPFAIKVLFRQLILYIQFTNDLNAKRFLAYLEDKWKSLRLNIINNKD